MDDVETLLRTADAADAAWDARARALPPEARRALVRAAVARLPADPAAARAVLAAVPDALDARDPALVAPLLPLLREISREPRLEALFARLAAGAADPDVELEASLVCGQAEVVRGEHDAADRRYRALLPRVAGTGRRAERVLFLAWGRLCLQGQRDVEALGLARRAAALMEAADDAWGLALARLHVSAVLANLHDFDRMEPALLEVEALFPRLTPEQRLRLGSTMDGRRAEAALERRDLPRALALIDAAERKGEASPYAGSDARTGPVLRARALLACGRGAEARAALDAGAGLGDPHDRMGTSLRALEVLVRHAVGDPDTGAAAQAFVTSLHGPAAARLGPGLRLFWARRVAEGLADARGCGAVVATALATAAGAGLERIAEVDRFLRTVSPYLRPTDADAAVFADHRRRTVESWRHVRRGMADRLRRSAEDRRAMLYALGNEHGMVAVCAWCGRVRRQDGRWASMQAWLPDDLPDVLPTTHGVCPTCQAAVTAELDDPAT